MFLAALGPIMSLAGTAVSAMGTIAGANAQAAGLRYQAEVARRKGVQEEAAAQRSALEASRKADVAQSRGQAVAAASGAGASDMTVVDNAKDLAGRGAYQSGLAQWQGNMRGWDYKTDAIAKEASAKAVTSGARLSAFGTILGGAGSLFKAFGSGSFGGSGSTIPSADSVFGSQDDDYWDKRFPTWNTP
jgi:hypothetical protein